MFLKKIYILLLFISFVFPSLKAWNTDSLQISLLTVMPRSNEVYTVYGHTALRIYDPTQNRDLVFNYGMFNFNEPNFLFRFLKGETDYSLGVESYDNFLYGYYRGNSTVIEQILDISPQGKNDLLQMLSINLMPENLIYRYNFLFDNCTTRIRDIIEKYSGGELIYPEQTQKYTFRELIHSCTNPYPWMTFGIDLLIGSGADSLVNLRQTFFLPLHFKEALDKSYVNNSLIVISSEEVLKSSSDSSSELKFWDSPLKVGFFIFAIYLLIAFLGYIKRRKLKGAFGLLFLIAGLAGILIGFMTLFSYHPCTSSNWNLLWLHPFHLIAFIGYFFKKSYRIISWYHVVNLVLLSVLLIGWYWIPQGLNVANIPYILCLGLASGYWLYRTKQIRNGYTG